MSIPVITFFNNKGGVGKTSLVYHLSWMFSDLGMRTLAVDLDPQANLSSAFLRMSLKACSNEKTRIHPPRFIKLCAR
jgi:cellulose biosynthesis protein BcsQ